MKNFVLYLLAFVAGTDGLYASGGKPAAKPSPAAARPAASSPLLRASTPSSEQEAKVKADERQAKLLQLARARAKGSPKPATSPTSMTRSVPLAAKRAALPFVDAYSQGNGEEEQAADSEEYASSSAQAGRPIIKHEEVLAMIKSCITPHLTEENKAFFREAFEALKRFDKLDPSVRDQISLLQQQLILFVRQELNRVMRNPRIAAGHGQADVLADFLAASEAGQQRLQREFIGQLEGFRGMPRQIAREAMNGLRDSIVETGEQAIGKIKPLLLMAAYLLAPYFAYQYIFNREGTINYAYFTLYSAVAISFAVYILPSLLRATEHRNIRILWDELLAGLSAQAIRQGIPVEEPIEEAAEGADEGGDGEPDGANGEAE